MTIQIRKAERRKAKLRLGIAAPSGGGKTYGAILLAMGLGGKIGLIDTENGSGDLYAHLTDYDIISLTAPYEIKKYLDAIKAFEDAGYDNIIIDSLSHAWAGDGGLLDKQGKMTDRGTNSFAAWRTITPEHNALVDAMLKSPCHIIATMRSKQEYVLETNEKGKQMPKKVGLAPVQREGMDFEMTIMIDVDIHHNATASKDRTGILDGKFFKLTPEIGKQLKVWLEDGVEDPAIKMKVAAEEINKQIAAATTLKDLDKILPYFAKDIEVMPDTWQEKLKGKIFDKGENLTIYGTSKEIDDAFEKSKHQNLKTLQKQTEGAAE